jgi:hypothetical protein
MSELSREQQLDAILHSYLQGADAGQKPDPAEMVRRHPAFAEDLRAFFADQEKMARFARSLNEACLDQTTVAPTRVGPDDANLPSPSETGIADESSPCRASATSAITNCSRKSRVAAWGSSTRRSR